MWVCRSWRWSPERHQQSCVFDVQIHVNESKIRNMGRGGNMESHSFIAGMYLFLKQKVREMLQMLIFVYVWSIC